MTLSSGSGLGPLGAGSMGEVMHLDQSSRFTAAALILSSLVTPLFAAAGDTKQTSSSSTSQPLRDEKLWQKALEIGAPQPLFDLKAAGTSSYSPQQYDVAPDGKRFLIVRRAGGDDFDPVVADLNWVASLKP